MMEAKGEQSAEAAEQLERLLFILHTLVSHRDGAKITKPEAICQVRKPYFPMKANILHHVAFPFLTAWFSPSYSLVSADSTEADSELDSVNSLLPPAAPDHLLSAAWREHQPAQVTHPGDSSKGDEKKFISCFGLNKCVCVLLFLTVFS